MGKIFQSCYIQIHINARSSGTMLESCPRGIAIKSGVSVILRMLVLEDNRMPRSHHHTNDSPQGME
jgi:hypothetical protein